MELRTPQEIINNLTKKRELLLSKTIATIAQKLEDSFNGTLLKIYIEEPKDLLLAIEKQLKKKFENKGWILTIGSCTSNRDGYVTTVSVSAINQASVARGNTDNFEQQWER